MCSTLERRSSAPTSALRSAAEGESFPHLSEVIERYAPHTRMLPSELRDAKQAKSALLSAAARELGGLAHAASRKHSTKPTAAQIEEALAKYEAYPEAGSIGESIGTLRPLLPKRRAPSTGPLMVPGIAPATDFIVFMIFR